MNKYEQNRKTGARDMTARDIRCIEHEGVAARMRKPGYRRKMRHTQSKYTKRTSH